MSTQEIAVDAKPRKRRWWRWVLLVLALGVLLFGIWAYKVMRSIAGPHGSIVDVWNGLAHPRSQFPNESRIVILIVGKDYDHDSKDMPSTANSRSDTVMLLCADLEHKQLSAVSIPRDTRVTGPDGKHHKINAMLPQGGEKLLEDTIEKEFGVRPQYHLILKDLAVKNLVDAVGGVDVDVLDEMFYQDSWGALNIDLHKGHQHLTGDQSIGYVRFRKMGDHKIVDGKIVRIAHRSSLEEGDIRRTERQQILLRALMSEAMRPGNLLHADHIIDVGFDQMQTNLSRTQVLALATIFKGQTLSNSPSATVPGSDNTDDGVYYFVADPVRTKLTMQWLIEGDESAHRKLCRVLVYHAGGTPALSKNAADMATDLGFTAYNGGPSQSAEKSTITFRKAAVEPFARELATKFGITDVQKDTSDPRADWKPEIKVIVGTDVAASLQSHN